MQIKGRVDRVERDEEGRAVVIDLKTGSAQAQADGELDRHPQLGVYQLAALLGAFERHGLTEPGGAELVQVGKAAGKTPAPGAGAAARWPRTPTPAGPQELVDTVAIGMSGPVLPGQGERRLPHLRGQGAAARCNDSGGQVC